MGSSVCLSFLTDFYEYYQIIKVQHARVPVQRYVGALLMYDHFMELQCSATVEDVDVWLEELPMFVPTLSCFDPKVVNAGF